MTDFFDAGGLLGRITDQPRRPRGRPRMANATPVSPGFDQYTPITVEEQQRHNAIAWLAQAQKCLLEAQTHLLNEGRPFEVVDAVTRIESDVVGALRSYRATVWKEEHP